MDAEGNLMTISLEFERKTRNQARHKSPQLSGRDRGRQVMKSLPFGHVNWEISVERFFR